MDKVRFGIIGLGGIATRFAKVLNTCADAELVAVAARDQNRADKFAQEFHSKKAYGNYSDLMKDAEVDIIYVALTHNFHYEIAKECIAHGKGILCEKPFFISQKEAEEVVALAKEKNVFLMEAMWTRCLPSYQKAKEWINSGKIGDVKFITASFTFSFKYNPEHRLYNPDLAGGALYDAGVYPIEFATGLLEENPTEITSLNTTAPNGVDDFDLISMKFPSGALTSLTCGFTAKTDHDAKIFGTNGYITVHEFHQSKKCELYNNNGELVDTLEDKEEDGFIHEINHVIKLYRDKQIQSNLIPWEDTIQCAGIFDKLIAQWHKK